MIEARDPVLAGLLGSSPCWDLSGADLAVMLESRVQDAINAAALLADRNMELESAQESLGDAERELEDTREEIMAYKKIHEAIVRWRDGEIDDEALRSATLAVKKDL